MTIFEYIILFSSVLIGGGLAFLVRKNNKFIMQLVLSLSGAYLLGITVLHLMPAVFAVHNHLIGFFVMAGFLLQLFLEQLSGGVEHGHIHLPHNSSAQFAISVMIGLCVHAFLEGMPLSNYEAITPDGHHHHLHEHNHLLYGVIMHKAPAAFALSLLFLMAEYEKWKVVLLVIIFSAMSPLGAFLSELFVLDVQMQLYVMAAVIGSFLHISTTILFETDATSHHNIPIRRLIAILIGIGMASATVLL